MTKIFFALFIFAVCLPDLSCGPSSSGGGGTTASPTPQASATPTVTQASAPSFSPAEGDIYSSQSVTITSSTTDAQIYYTIDGTTPTASSTAYSSAVTINGTTTIKAMAVKSGLTDSSVSSATYTFVKLRMFITTSSYAANLGSSATLAIQNADNDCSTDASNPHISDPTDSASFKAMLVSSTRQACSTANCSNGISENLNWILKPSVTYYRLDKSTVIGSTSASALLNFNLTNSITDSLGVSYMTGLATDWTNSANTCLDWTSAAAQDSFNYGYGGSVSSGAVSSSNNPCNQTGKLLCVEQ